jgi:hypothetical protein
MSLQCFASYMIPISETIFVDFINVIKDNLVAICDNDPALSFRKEGGLYLVEYSGDARSCGRRLIRDLIALPDVVEVRFASQPNDYEEFVPVASGRTQREEDNVIRATGYILPGKDRYYFKDQAGVMQDYSFADVFYHELAFARRLALGNAIKPLDLVQDENEWRAENGRPLRVSSNVYWQHVYQYDLGGKPCFIVSAAYGSPMAPAVDQLKALRDQILRRTALGESFFAALFEEYDRFSPWVAADMQRHPALRSAIRDVLVGPLIEVLRLALLWAQHNADASTTAFPTRINTTSADSALVANALEQAHSRLQNHEYRLADWPAPPETSEPAAVIEYVTAAIEAGGGARTFILWALVEPLILYWRARAELARSPAESASIRSTFFAALGDWLCSVPFPQTMPPMPPAQFAADLTTLTDAIFVHEAVHTAFVARAGTRSAGTKGRSRQHT